MTFVARKNITFLDCTLRDGGYYNDWDFSPELINEYLLAMVALQVDYVEIGFRLLNSQGFKGGCAFSTDSFLNSLSIPVQLKNKIGVMVNGSDLLPEATINTLSQDEIAIKEYQHNVLNRLFKAKSESPVSLVRIACHVHEFKSCLPASIWLKEKGYKVGFNLMQVADRAKNEITELAKEANQYPIDVLYFADSMGSLNPEETHQIVMAFKRGWQHELGIHTHDNMGQAIANSLQAITDDVSWVDSTVTGMGRGPGNAQTEYMAIALEDYRVKNGNFTPLLELIRKHFKPMQTQYGWGTNPYYYLAGKYGIHPSYIQEMLIDCRYSEEDILSVIEHLKIEGGKKFSLGTLEVARHFYAGELKGTWKPENEIKGNDVLIIGTGPSVARHQKAIEAYILKHKPYVIALNAQQTIDESLINVRAACHPVRLLADCQEYLQLPQPLITPASMLPEDVKNELSQKTLFDYGIMIKPEVFEFSESYCTLPRSLVIAYALAIATSGKAKRILLVGFDGYQNEDARNKELDNIFRAYSDLESSLEITSLTPTRYQVIKSTIYGEL